MKTFYTVRDIEDMHAAGVAEIDIHDDVVLTDAAREKAISLGIRLRPVDEAIGQHQALGRHRMAVETQSNMTNAGDRSLPDKPAAAVLRSLAPATTDEAPADLIKKIKSAVAARLGTDRYNGLLDKIIPQVMNQLKK